MTPLGHAAGLVLLLVILVGPVPLALSLAAGGAPIDGRRGPGDVVVGLVGWCVLQVGLALVLGTMGLLHLGGALAGEALLLVAGMAVRRSGAGAREAVSHAAPAAAVALAIAFVVVGSGLVVHSLATPVTEVDSLAYHLPAMARWYQAGALVRLTPLPRVQFYPFDWEALATLVVLPFGEDFAVSLPNVVAWSTFALAITSLAISLGAHPVAALAAALLAGTMPLTLHHLPTMQVDLPLGAFFMAALALACHAPTRRPAAADIPFLAAAGLVAGIKASGPVYAGLLLFARALRPPGVRPPPRGRPPTATLAIVAGAAALAGTYWGTRNLFETGNPFGTVRVALGPLTLFPGSLDPSALRRSSLLAAMDPREGAQWRILVAQAWSLGRLPLVFLVLGAVTLVVRRSPARTPAGSVPFLWALLGATGLVYAATPFSAAFQHGAWRVTAWTGLSFRYAFPTIGVLATAAALGCSRLALAGRTLAAIAMVVAAQQASGWPLAAGAGAGLAAVGLLRAARRASGTTRWSVALAAAILLVAGTWRLRVERAAARLTAYGPVFDLVTTLPPEDAVGYVTRNRSYPLYGRWLARRVEYVPAAGRDAEDWAAELRRRHLTLVALGPLGRRGRMEAGWVTRADGPFAHVTDGDPERGTELYRLR